MNTSFDVVVVGGGNAALVSALTAHQEGARVVILDASTEAERGGNSRFAGAIFRIAHNGLDDLRPLLCEAALADVEKVAVGAYTRELYEADLMTTSQGRSDPGQMEVLFSNSLATVQWMRDQGVQWELNVGKYFSREAAGDARLPLPLGAELRVHGEGVGLMAALWAAVERAGIEVHYETPACDLISEGDTIRGVRARQRDRFVDFHGKVVLASGGFEASPAMRRRYLGDGWDLVKVRGTRFNTGVMLDRAMNAGAQSFGHIGGCHSSPQDMHAPNVGDLGTHNQTSRYSYPFSIMVNVEGRRFMDEGEDLFALTYAKTGDEIRRQPRGVAYQIFDQKALHLLEPRYRTSRAIEADSIGGLAEKLGIDPKVLERTVADYNAACGAGEFDPFRKDGLKTADGYEPRKSNWARPIDQGPFVAHGVTCGITFTYGGIRTDLAARVLSNENQPMPNLYATGEIVGGLFWHNYPGGAGLTRGAVFGRIAGREAARLALAERQAVGTAA